MTKRWRGVNRRWPPIADQRRIAADLSRRLAEAERLAGRIQYELAAIEALAAALIARGVWRSAQRRLAYEVP